MHTETMGWDIPTETILEYMQKPQNETTQGLMEQADDLWNLLFSRHELDEHPKLIRLRPVLHTIDVFQTWYIEKLARDMQRGHGVQQFSSQGWTRYWQIFRKIHRLQCQAWRYLNTHRYVTRERVPLPVMEESE